ncbi:hypothetical protein ZWY2020_032106 [Hordeum vulgare]|nr:hypothetical protein ZWY2020_032106 [Hordeum vulgare]
MSLGSALHVSLLAPSLRRPPPPPRPLRGRRQHSLVALAAPSTIRLPRRPCLSSTQRRQLPPAPEHHPPLNPAPDVVRRLQLRRQSSSAPNQPLPPSPYVLTPDLAVHILLPSAIGRPLSRNLNGNK